jgi:hypothetical protein
MANEVEVAPKADESKPAVGAPVMGMLRSKKALVMLAAVASATVLVALGKANLTEAGAFVGVIIAVWIHAQGGVDKAKAESAK